ncbi:MAG: tetratricopeptide repeat protein [Bacteroidia bacterium]
MRRGILFIFTVLLVLSGYSQSNKSINRFNEDDANEHFKNKNFVMAIPIYRNELKKHPFDDKMRFKLAQCLLSTRINREEAITHLNELLKNNSKYHEAWFELGRAYFLTNRLGEAEDAFNEYLKLKPKGEDEVNVYKTYIANARKFMEQPSNVTFQNLGGQINSSDPDYYPFTTADESFLAFTSRRQDNVGGKKIEMDGYRNSDVYFSKIDLATGAWEEAKNAGRAINTSLDEQVVGINNDGTEIVVYMDHIDKYGDLYSSERKDKSADFGRCKLLDPIINANIEITGTFNQNNTVFFFARKEKIKKNTDLYVCRKLPTGKWSMPLRLPDNINTDKNEDFPYYVEEGSTLYFASEGHNSMGGYDLYKTTWNIDDNTCTDPENLGFPINSTDDDRSICVTPDNRVAYISAFRPGGFGELDIYRIRFNDNEQINRIVTGQVFFGDTVSKNQPKESVATIIASNKKSKEEYTFVPNHKTGRYVISLPVGEYDLLVSSSGYEKLTDYMLVSDFGNVEIEKAKNYVLKKTNNSEQAEIEKDKKEAQKNVQKKSSAKK